jgi:cytochrome P450
MDSALYAKEQPIRVLGELRDRHGIFWHDMPPGNPYGHRGYWSVLKHKDVVAVSQDPGTFSSERQGPLFFNKLDVQEGAIISIDPPKHRRLRSFVNPSFLPTPINQLEVFVRDLIAGSLEHAIERSDVEFVYEVAAHIPTKIFCRMMNVPEEESSNLIGWVDDIAANITTPGPRLIQVLASIAEYGNLLAETRAGLTGNDVVAAMMRASHEDGPLSRTEFGSLFMTIVTGASETMRSLLSHTVLTFCRRPDLLDDLRRNPDIVDTAVEEFLRLATPLNFFRRTLTRDIVFKDVHMREDDVIVIWYLSANFDPTVFDKPEQIDLRRKPNKQLSFGIGEHFCLGARLARLQAKVFLQEFCKRVARVELLEEPERIAQPQFNVYHHLRVRLVPI